jgi:hypothetical protein
MSRIATVIVGSLALALAVAAPAAAGKPDRWILSGASSVPNTYWQGLTSDPTEESVFFAGTFEGLWRTTPQLAETAGVASAIPASVKAREGYNHIGDPTWNEAQDGIVLPFECFTPGVGNFCGTGSFGIADPRTLALRYYVKLDPAEIPKAMWAETSPDGSLVWTSSGDDLLAYRSSEISRANRAPAGPLLEAAERLEGAVPPSGITGAVFRGGRLLLAGAGDDAHQVWSVDTETGDRRLVLERSICGESEGLDVIRTLGGKLHWLIAPFDPGCELSFGPTSALLHFVRSRGHRRYEVEVIDVDGDAIPGKVTARIRARREGGPLRNGRIRFAGAKGRTNDRGFANVSTTLERPGRFKAVARKHRRWGASGFVQVGEPAPAPRAAPDNGAG